MGFTPREGSIPSSGTNLRSRLCDASPRMPRVVITGCPGGGKTALLTALHARGYTIVGDSAREIIRERRARGLGARPGPQAFAQELLRRDVESFLRHATTPGAVFFERGVVDALCAVDLVGPLADEELRTCLSTYQYCSRVFVLPPWQAIYVNDAERDHPFEHAEWVDRITRDWYRRCGYEVVEVPRVSVDERCAFVLQSLALVDA